MTNERKYNAHSEDGNGSDAPLLKFGEVSGEVLLGDRYHLSVVDDHFSVHCPEKGEHYYAVPVKLPHGVKVKDANLEGILDPAVLKGSVLFLVPAEDNRHV
jgi:hypothetical protein